MDLSYEFHLRAISQKTLKPLLIIKISLKITVKFNWSLLGANEFRVNPTKGNNTAKADVIHLKEVPIVFSSQLSSDNWDILSQA